MSAAPLDDRVNARAQLEHFAKTLYAEPTAALRAMRHDAHVEGAKAVAHRLGTDFLHYGEPSPELHGPKRVHAQEALRVGGVAADVERWLTIDHTAPQQQWVVDTAIERVMGAPDAEALGRHPAQWDRRTPASEGKEVLSPEERLAFEQLEAYASARERETQRQAAEAQLHAIADHRENLRAAEEGLPQAKAALHREIEETYSDGRPGVLARRRGISEESSAREMIEQALKRDGPAETARRLRSGELLGNRQIAVNAQKRFFGSVRRDSVAAMEARERVAKRVETLGYHEGDLGKWSTFRPQDGPPVSGAKNVRAALDREEARVLAESGLGPVRDEIARNRPPALHPSREASQVGTAALRQLDRLSPESRERVAQAAQRAGGDRITAALGHLQTIQMAVRSLREGVEPPGM